MKALLLGLVTLISVRVYGQYRENPPLDYKYGWLELVLMVMVVSSWLYEIGQVEELGGDMSVSGL